MTVLSESRIRPVSTARRLRRIVAAVLLATLGVAGAAGMGLQATAQCDANGRADNLGININNMSFAALRLPNLVAALRQSGAGWTRINIYWGWIERAPGNYNWKDVDDGLEILAANKINAVVTLNGPVPCWHAAKKVDEPCKGPLWSLPRRAAWNNFVRMAVTRYADKVKYWEIWNEPNLVYAIDNPVLGDRLADYRESLLIPGAIAIRAADPKAKIVAPVLAGATGGAETPEKLARMLSDILIPAVRGYVDVVSFHVYPPADLTAFGAAARQELNRIGMRDRPIWLTETGALVSFHYGEPVSRIGQLDFFRGNFESALNSGLYGKLFWFALVDNADTALAHVSGYGLIEPSDHVTYAWSPRPSFTHFQRVAERSCRQE
jgi:polysaccharide biosynthesis protein PslG